MSSDKIGFNQIAQLVNKFEKVGWNTERITQLGQADEKQFRAIETILDAQLFELIEIFNEVAFFQTRSDLIVSPDLERYVGLETRPTRSHTALKQRYRFSISTSEAKILNNLTYI